MDKRQEELKSLISEVNIRIAELNRDWQKLLKEEKSDFNIACANFLKSLISKYEGLKIILLEELEN